MKTITKRILFLVAVLLAVPVFIFAFSKGDLLIAQDSNSMARLPLGQDGQVLTVSSTAPLGMAWVTPTIPVKHFQVDTGKTLTTGLRTYYKLEDLNDFWSTNDLMNNNGAAFATGRVNNGADFGNMHAGEYLTVASNNGVQGGNSTFAGWVNVSSQPATNSNDQIFVQRDGAGSHVAFSLNYNDTAGVKGLRVSRSKMGVGEDVAIFPQTLVTGTWYYLAYVYDGNTVTMYVNNVPIGTVSSSGYGSTNQGIEFTLGGPAGNTFSGLVDEWGVWSRALSTTEISDLYNGGNGQTIVQ